METVSRRVILRNLAPTGTQTGAANLEGTVTITVDTEAENPPEVHLLPRGDDPDFSVQPGAVYAYTFGASASGITTPGVYTGTITWGNDLCDGVSFSFSVVNRSEPAPSFALRWGTEGPGTGEFMDIRSVATDAEGNVYVVDNGQDLLKKYAPDGQFLTSRSVWDQGGILGPTELINPTAVAVGPDGKVYVADNNPLRVTVFNPDLSFNVRFGPTRTGSAFSSIEDIGVDREGFIYVLDRSAFQVRKFQLTDRNPYFEQVDAWGGRGSANGKFNLPISMAVTADGDVYVGDALNQWVTKFDNEGTYLLKWGSDGNGAGEFEDIEGVGVDVNGTVFVTDVQLNRIQMFDSNGSFVSEWGKAGIRDGEFDGPGEIAADPLGGIYVVDKGHFQIQKFTRQTAPSAASR